MDQPFNVSGVWWAEEENTTQVVGWLEFNGTGETFLNTMGDIFGDKKPPHFPVLGMTNTGDRYTLLDCRFINAAPPSIGTHRYVVRNAIFKNHFIHSKEDLRFTSVSFCLEQLKDWFDLGNGITWQFPDSKGGVSVEHKFLESPIYKAKNLTFQLYLNGAYTFSRNKVSLEEIPVIIIRSEQPRTYNVYLQMITYLREYFTVLFGAVTYPYNVKAYISETREPSLLEEEVGEKEIEVFNNRFPFDTERSTDFGFGDRPRYSQIGQIMLERFDAWCTLTESFEAVMSLFYAGLNTSVDINVEFLLLAQAIEVYHRTKFGGHYIDDEEYHTQGGLYEQLLNFARPHVEDAFYMSLERGKFKYLHHYSLNKRLNLLLKRIDNDSLKAALFSNIHPRELTDYVVGTRNYLTHWEKGSDAKIASKRGLYALTYILRNFLLVQLMMDLEVPVEIIEKLLLPFPHYYDPPLQYSIPIVE